MKLETMVQARYKVIQPAIVWLVISPIVILVLYVLSICWRVSWAEHQYFGRSTLFPVSFSSRQFDKPPVALSYGSKTYDFDGPCGHVVVWRQKINGFQHMYGSALACAEIGDFLADQLFCLNEVAEFTLDWNGVEPSDLLDRKKDLANNALGRSIARQLRNECSQQRNTDKSLVQECVRAVESNPAFLPHFLDPRVFVLSEKELGCNYLPVRNLFNLFQGLL